MVGSSTITSTWTRRFTSTKRLWHNPQDSTGQLYRKMGRDSSCWEAIGSARETFIRIADDIKAHLEKYSNPVPHPVTWTIYMIGPTRETSEPTIMFCCRDTHCRKQVRKTVKDSGILKDYPGVKLGDASRPPDFDQLVQLAGISLESVMPGVSIESLLFGLRDPADEAPEESLYKNKLALARQSGNLFGKAIAIPLYDQDCILISVRTATGGGILRSGTRYFYLTAGHAFEIPADSPLPKLVDDDDDDFEFDIGESSESEAEVDFVEATSRGSITPELADSCSSDITTEFVSGSAAFTAPLGDGISAQENLKENWKDVVELVDGTSKSDGTALLLPIEPVVMGRLLSTLDGQSRPSLDYALIEINDHFRDFDQQPMKEEIDSPYLSPQGIVKSPQNANVLCVTGSAGLLKGTMSGTPTYKTIPDFNEIQELWTVRLEGSLTNGDCGSWVVDAQSGNLLGHIVAGSPESGVAYIVPAYHVFEDAKTRFGLNLDLCMTTESEVRTEAPQVKISSSADPGLQLGENQPIDSATATMKGKNHELESTLEVFSREAVMSRLIANDDFLERRRQLRIVFQNYLSKAMMPVEDHGDSPAFSEGSLFSSVPNTFSESSSRFSEVFSGFLGGAREDGLASQNSLSLYHPSSLSLAPSLLTTPNFEWGTLAPALQVPGYGGGLAEGLAVVTSTSDYDGGLTIADESIQPLAYDESTLTPSTHAMGYPMRHDSSFYKFGGFCDGAKAIIRGEEGFKIVKKPSALYRVTVASRCIRCSYEVSWENVEKDKMLQRAGIYCNSGIKWRQRFISKCHLWTKSADEPLYACIFCVEEQRTVEAHDATVFFSVSQLFRHLAKHPQPLPNVAGIDTFYGPQLPEDVDFDLHFPSAMKPILYSLGDIASKVATRPSGFAITTHHPKSTQSNPRDPNWNPALHFAIGARIVGVTFPEHFGGQGCIGYHDGEWGSFPRSAIQLEVPAKEDVVMNPQSSLIAFAKWDFKSKDVNHKGWLQFSKGSRIFSIGYPFQDHWCWSGQNSKGVWGVFPAAFVEKLQDGGKTGEMASPTSTAGVGGLASRLENMSPKRYNSTNQESGSIGESVGSGTSMGSNATADSGYASGFPEGTSGSFNKGSG